VFFLHEELLDPRPTPKLKDHRLSAVSNFIFDLLADIIYIWKPSPPFAI